MAARLLSCVCLVWIGAPPVDESQCVGQPLQGQVCNVIEFRRNLDFFVKITKKLQMNVSIEVYLLNRFKREIS